MKRLFLGLIATISALAFQSCTQRIIVSDYNYRKALDAYYDEHDCEKALMLIGKQLEETPRHIDSRYLRALIYCHQEKYYAALRDLSPAIRGYSQKSAIHKSSLFGLQGFIYGNIQYYSESAESFRRAKLRSKSDNPDKVEYYTLLHADALYFSHEIHESDNVYYGVLNNHCKSGFEAVAMTGLARNRMEEKQYEEALGWLDKARDRDCNCYDIYKLRMQIYNLMEDKGKSIDNALEYYIMDDKSDPSYVSYYLCSDYGYSIERVREKTENENASPRWFALLATLLEIHGDYASALEIYERAEARFGESDIISYWKSVCYSEIDEQEKALEAIDRAIGSCDKNSYHIRKGDIFRGLGNYSDAIEEYEKGIDMNSSCEYEYYAIGTCFEEQGLRFKALEFYDKSISMDKSYYPALVRRAALLKELGWAQEDYQYGVQSGHEPIADMPGI